MHVLKRFESLLPFSILIVSLFTFLLIYVLFSSNKETSTALTPTKNWEIQGDIKTKGMPQAKKNLLNNNGSTDDQKIIESRPRPKE